MYDELNFNWFKKHFLPKLNVIKKVFIKKECLKVQFCSVIVFGS